MKKTKFENIALLFLALLALSTAILGYSGLLDRLTRDRYEDLKYEAHRIIDLAQLWYNRPQFYGGGGKSFEGLDFKDLGYAQEDSVTTLIHDLGVFELENITENSFDLAIKANDGAKFSAQDITFNKRVEITLKE